MWAHPHQGNSTQSVPGDGSTSGQPHSSPIPMELDNQDEEAHLFSSSGDSSLESIQYEVGYSEPQGSDLPGVRAASNSRIPAHKVAQQTALAQFRANIAVAMKHLPKEAFPPPATPQLHKPFAVSADPQPVAAQFMQFPPSEGFARAFRRAQDDLFTQGKNSLTEGGRATHKVVRQMAKYPVEKRVPVTQYSPLTPMWASSTRTPDELAPLLRAQGRGTSSQPRLEINQSMFNTLEQSTRAPLNVLSYADCFNSAKQALPILHYNLAFPEWVRRSRLIQIFWKQRPLVRSWLASLLSRVLC